MIAVRRAIERGVLVRPSNCSKCGCLDRKCANGVTYIQAHHEDYSKPLDVVWLCVKCHRAITPLMEVFVAPAYGSQNGQAKRTEADVLAIRASPLSSSKLGRVYGVHKTTIQRAKGRRQWNHI